MKGIPITEIVFEGQQIDLLRLDLAQPSMQGNKWWKLKYNLEEAKRQHHETLLSFGGAFSNHIHAVAVAGKQFGFKTIGVIRGEDDPQNPTLNFVREQGMLLKFVSRATYQQKTEAGMTDELSKEFGDFYLLPEGGTNREAVKGCSEILEGLENSYDRIFCAVGTGGTLAGLISTPRLTAKVTGVVVLKGAERITEKISGLLSPPHAAWELNHDYHLSGYARYNGKLIDFIRWFMQAYLVPLDPVYTGKLLFAVTELIRNGEIRKGTRILAVHTGGLQGIAGWEYRFGKIIS